MGSGRNYPPRMMRAFAERNWSLVQLTGLLRSHEVGARRRGCCTHLLYRCPALFNFGITRQRRISPVPGLLRQSGAIRFRAEFAVADQRL